MAKLILTFHDQVVDEFELSKPETTIGRKSDNDIRIDNLAVSGHHASIMLKGSKATIVDLDSTNGTFVDGERIKQKDLHSGDIVTIGKYQIRFVADNDSYATAEMEKTMIISPSEMGMPTKETSAALENSIRKAAGSIQDAHPKPKTGSKAKLVIMSGANAHREIELTKVLTTIGKPGTQVAAITRRPSGYFLLHIDGGGGDKMPMVNSSPIGPQAHPLHDGDIIQVANVEMRFSLA